MLADTIEAASRTLHSPSATRLRQFVHDLIMDKMLDNQLDECGLTFADLALIEDAFLRVLATRFHSRIRYPGQDEEGPAGERKRSRRRKPNRLHETSTFAFIVTLRELHVHREKNGENRDRKKKAPRQPSTCS